MLLLCCVLLVLVTRECSPQEEDGVYKGKYIGDFNTYANQVSGEVYAVDDWTLLLWKLFYNGEGRDTYFWAGESGRSGPQGYIVPDELGTTDVLRRYNGTGALTLRLPGGKRVSRLRWLAVYDIDTQNVYGDVYIPSGLDPPAPRALAALAPSPGSSGAVSSAPLRFLDSKTLEIPEFRYDGSGEEVYFWTGVGPQPSPRGHKIPDELGYLEPLRVYNDEDVRLELPGSLSVFQVNWVSVYDVARNLSLAAASIPDALNVPASLLTQYSYKSSLPHCKQLHRDYQVSWEVFGSQITIQLAAVIDEEDYMAFGISGSNSGSRMVGADVAVARFDRVQQRALATDYNITDMTPCVQVLGQWRGVCRDDLIGGLDSNQVISGTREDSLTVVTYRRTLQPAEELDREWATERPTWVVWALGRLDASLEPGFHRAYNKRDLPLRIDAAAGGDCFEFTRADRSVPSAWDIAALTDPALRVFGFRLGPSAGERGVSGRTGARFSPPLAWYVEGQLAPDLQLRRGLVYTFHVWGGDDPHSAARYHPLLVAEAPGGGGRVLAGVHYTRRAKPTPTAAGGLCLAEATRDRRRDVQLSSFRTYNRSLRWDCGDARAADLTIAPNSSWPDVVYYDSFTHAGMGGRIYIVDRAQRSVARPGAAPPAQLPPGSQTLLLLALLASFLLAQPV